MVENAVRQGVGMILMNENSEYTLGRRKTMTGYGKMCLPGGSVEFGETFVQGGLRENTEETGISASDVEIIGCVSERYNKVTKWTNYGVLAKTDCEPKTVYRDRLMGVESWKQHANLQDITIFLKPGVSYRYRTEVDDWQWYTQEQIVRIIKEGKVFKPSADSLVDYFEGKRVKKW